MELLKHIGKLLRKKWDLFNDTARAQSVDIIELEKEELENIFSLLVFSSFVGLPSPPMQITLELMPHMEKELLTMLEKVDTAIGPISHMFSIFNVG